MLDKLVELLASLMDAVGLSGRRLRWKWQHRQRAIDEARSQGQNLFKQKSSRHKMCPECRTLVSNSTAVCPDCGSRIAAKRSSATERTVSKLFPGLGSTTSLILITNGLLFFLLMLAQIKSGNSRIFGFDGGLLVRFGSGLNFPVRLSDGIITGGEWWRWVTPIFLHSGLIHFGFNSWVLIQIGQLVEELYGSRRLWVIYLLCGISGAGLSQIIRNEVNTVGASGAILGLIGLLMVYGWRSKDTFGARLKSMMLRFIVFIIIIGFIPGIDSLNHLGGLVCGALLALIVPTGQDRNHIETTIWRVLSIGGVLLVLFSFFQVAQLIKQIA
jgi:rhomboid protease GluP